MPDTAYRPPLPEHVTTPLLSLITERSLDEDYAHVAARRAALGADAPPQVKRRWSTTAVVALFGGLATIAAVQTSQDADVAELGRVALISRITDTREEVTALQGDVRSLKVAALNAEAHHDELEAMQADLTGRLRRLEVATGYVAVRGEGVRIQVTNPSGGDPNDEVRDEDLATLVDGLWHAGAEAIAINDVRLTVLGGIRNTGRAVHVNGVGLSPPYVVTAIGDTAILQARLLESSQGREWFGLVNGLGFGYVADNVEDLRLPASSLRPLRDVTEGTAADNAGRPVQPEGATP